MLPLSKYMVNFSLTYYLFKYSLLSYFSVYLYFGLHYVNDILISCFLSILMLERPSIALKSLGQPQKQVTLHKREVETLVLSTALWREWRPGRWGLNAGCPFSRKLALSAHFLELSVGSADVTDLLYLSREREAKSVFGSLEAQFHSKESLEGC